MVELEHGVVGSRPGAGARERPGPALPPVRDAGGGPPAGIERPIVLLVDEHAAIVGQSGKLEAHEPPGLLHLAFSAFLYRSDGRVLLQRRAASKYHFPLHWANACCSHPGPGEQVVESAERRVLEELGVSCALRPVGVFVYRATCPSSGLVEHELDHVLVGTTDDEPNPQPSEVAELRWVLPADVAAGRPEGAHAPWLSRALEIAEAGRRSGSAELPGAARAPGRRIP
ncbi:MAG TPA: isopentenyl-diphosphate Delta-isomerase [Acidimicrobiales bacterium]|nr:isopentenyl-diphosphate Delta-isomerase [Acidimicrobiales bacterium]